MDAHQPEGIRTVRAPIVVWPEPDVSIIVGFLFVIPAQRVAAGFGGGVVEEDPREVAPSRLNACRGRAGALVGHHEHVKAGFARSRRTSQTPYRRARRHAGG